MPGEEKRGAGNDRLLAAGRENTDRAGGGRGVSAVYTAAAAAQCAPTAAGHCGGYAAYGRDRRALTGALFLMAIYK